MGRIGRNIIQRSTGADGVIHTRRNETKAHHANSREKKAEERNAAEWEVCRDCDKEKCSGSRACMERRRRELEKEKEKHDH